MNICDIDVNIAVDNQSAIMLSKNPVFHQRSKHIDIRYHFIRDFITKGLIVVYYIESSKNTADMFTKAMSFPRLGDFYHIFGTD